MVLKNKNLIIILTAGLILRGIAASLTGPGFDEAYYGVYSLFLNSGYFDHPPLVSISAGIGLWLFNNFSAFALRLGAIVLFTISSLFLFATVKLLFDRKSALYAVVLFHVTPFFLIGLGAFVIPDNFLTLFWLLAIFAMAKYIQTQQNFWLLLWGAAIGFGFLSKYHIVLLITGFGWVMLFNSKFRKLWKNPWLYGAIFFGLLIMLPNIIWNYQHDWVSYGYQFGKSGGNSSLSFTKFYQGILSQVGYLLPWNCIILLLGFWSLKDHKWLMPIALFPIIVFTLFGVKQTILPHWPMPGYLTLLIPAGAYLSRQKWSVGYTIFSSVFTITLLTIVIFQAQFGFINLKPKHDFTLDGFGWNQMIRNAEQEDYFQDVDFLAGHKWFTAGEILFAGEGKYSTIALNPKDPRGFAFWYDLKKFKGKTCLFIATNRYFKDPAKKYSNYFSAITPVDTITVNREQNPGKTFYLWKCDNFTGLLKYPYGINHE